MKTQPIKWILAISMILTLLSACGGGGGGGATSTGNHSSWGQMVWGQDNWS